MCKRSSSSIDIIDDSILEASLHQGLIHEQRLDNMNIGVYNERWVLWDEKGCESFEGDWISANKVEGIWEGGEFVGEKERGNDEEGWRPNIEQSKVKDIKLGEGFMKVKKIVEEEIINDNNTIDNMIGVRDKTLEVEVKIVKGLYEKEGKGEERGGGFFNPLEGVKEKIGEKHHKIHAYNHNVPLIHRFTTMLRFLPHSPSPPKKTLPRRMLLPKEHPPNLIKFPPIAIRTFNFKLNYPTPFIFLGYRFKDA